MRKERDMSEIEKTSNYSNKPMLGKDEVCT